MPAFTAVLLPARERQSAWGSCGAPGIGDQVDGGFTRMGYDDNSCLKKIKGRESGILCNVGGKECNGFM